MPPKSKNDKETTPKLWQMKTTKEGNWIYRKDANGHPKWQKIKIDTKKAIDFYKQVVPPEKLKIKYDTQSFLNNAKKASKELKKHNILFYHIEWSPCYTSVDDAWSFAIDAAKEETGRSFDELSLLFFTENGLLSGSLSSGFLPIHHKVLKDEKEVAYSTLEKYFGKSLMLPKRESQVIRVKLGKAS